MAASGPEVLVLWTRVLLLLYFFTRSSYCAETRLPFLFETQENQYIARHWPRVVMKWPRLAATGSDWPPSDPASDATKNYLRGPPIRRIIAARVAAWIAVALSAGLTIAGKGSLRGGNQSRHFLCSSCCSCSWITNKCNSNLAQMNRYTFSPRETAQ